MPYSKYSSHSDISCNDAEYMKNKIIDIVADRNSSTNSFKKQDKPWNNYLNRYQMKTDKFYKLASQDLKKSDVNRIANNMEDSSDSDFDYNS